jgi:DNA polymerase-1
LYAEDDDVPEALAKQIRSLFITRDPQQVLVSIDYSQIEYRTAAYFSNDPVLLKKYRDDPTTDYHQATSELAGIDRDLAKTVNFGTLYGMGAGGLASALTGMGKPTTKDAAAHILAELMGKRPALARLIGSTSAQCSRDKYVLSIFGRICDVPMNKSYVGLNYRVQGTCGDLMRRAMLRVYAAMKENHWPIRMLISVHDELLFEMPIDRVEEVSLAIVKIMCDVPQMDIPLLCDVEVGDNWGDQAGVNEWKKVKQKPEKLLIKPTKADSYWLNLKRRVLYE